MTFPVYLHIGSLSIHPHPLFESIAYFLGFRVYLWTRNKERIPPQKAIWVLVGAIIGAALGSKVLCWFEDPVLTLHHWRDPLFLMSDKTIVGGLLGGLIGVEFAKKRIGWTRSTGDDFTLPLIVGMSIGRIGCFLTGLTDRTYGTPTTWITGVDFGDGIPRHPTQLYEIAFLWMLAVLLLFVKRGGFKSLHPLPEGAIFQLFMIGYLLFRLLIDFIKPVPHPYWIFNNIQLACLAGLIYYIRVVRRWHQHATHEEEIAHA